MTQRTTAREIIWMLNGMILLFNCWYFLLAPFLGGICGLPISDATHFWGGCVAAVAGSGIGFWVGMYLDHKRWNLKKQHEQDEAVNQLLNKYMLREIFIALGIWASGPVLLYIALILAGFSGDWL